jgi:propanol-preferring alcohol dehydrogenase
MVLAGVAPVERAPLALREVADPVPGPGEVVIAVRAGAVCRTDLHTVEGDLALPTPGIVPGHQVVGTVEGVGAGVARGIVGARVGLAWLWGACGACDACRRGDENLCPGAAFSGLHVNGGYAERVRARADFVYPLPGAFPDEQAAPLLCAGVIGLRALRLAGVVNGHGGTLGVYGFGASAHVAIQIAQHRGCRVFVFTRAQGHRDLARSLGAAWVGSPEQTPPDTLDHAVVFSPAGAHVPAALAHLAPGGTVACAGVTMSDIPEFPYDLLYGERCLRSVANATRDDARELLSLAAEIPLRTAVESVPLEEANEALLRVKRSEVNGAIVLRPQRTEGS